MKTQVLGLDGSVLREIELSDSVFSVDISEGSIYHAVRNELANLRQGTASTKTRSEVRGSGAKPWRQKGTGRARSGSRKSPVWVGGGTVFGPKPRDYSYKLPRKIKRLAVRSVLSLKLKDKVLKIIEDFTVESGKTKDLLKIVSGFVPDERTILVLKDNDKMVKRSGGNVPWLRFLSFDRLRVHDLFYCRHLLLMESAAKSLNDFYASN
ncbi:MAG: 50S ribosomal protein L4 [Spirochaetes bacterium]|nr:50S ribosomal protein L4 [Spirochaetota bacterium]